MKRISLIGFFYFLIVMALVAITVGVLSASPAHAQKGGDWCDWWAMEDSRSALLDLWVENGEVVAQFESMGTLCPDSIILEVANPWNANWEYVDWTVSFLENEIGPGYSMFQLRASVIEECWVARALLHDGWASRTLVSDTCSQEYRDEIPTQEIWPSIVITTEEVADAATDFANVVNATTMKIYGDTRAPDYEFLPEVLEQAGPGQLVLVVGDVSAEDLNLIEGAAAAADTHGFVRQVTGTELEVKAALFDHLTTLLGTPLKGGGK